MIRYKLDNSLIYSMLDYNEEEYDKKYDELINNILDHKLLKQNLIFNTNEYNCVENIIIKINNLTISIDGLILSESNFLSSERIKFSNNLNEKFDLGYKKPSNKTKLRFIMYLKNNFNMKIIYDIYYRNYILYGDETEFDGTNTKLDKISKSLDNNFILSILYFSIVNFFRS